jgi:hypothetical protein
VARLAVHEEGKLPAGAAVVADAVVQRPVGEAVVAAAAVEPQGAADVAAAVVAVVEAVAAADEVAAVNAVCSFLQPTFPTATRPLATHSERPDRRDG